MNKRQIDVAKANCKAEQSQLRSLKSAYRKASQDCAEKAKALLGEGEATQSKIYQANYQKALQSQIDGILDKMNEKNYSSVSKYLDDCYTNGFVGNMFDLHGQGIPLISPINQKQMAKAVQLDSKISEGLYKRMGKDTNKLKSEIKSEISRGVANGSSYSEISRNLNGRAEIGYNKAATIVRTEGHRIQNQSALDSMQEAKEKGADIVKQWDSTLDKKTRPEHKQLDGQLCEVGKDFTVSGMSASAPGMFGNPAQDCNCRCAVTQRAKWALDEDELQTLKDRAEQFGLDKTESFEEFKEKYLKAAEEVGNGEVELNGVETPEIPPNATDKIVDEAVDKSFESGIINIKKSVKIPEECSYLLKAETNFADKNISEDILKSIDSSIEKQVAEKADFAFDEIKVAKFPDGDKSVLITNYEYGIHSKTQLYLNKEFFIDSSLDDISRLCESQYESGWWKSKSVNDLVNHEIMHAKINHYNSVEKIERLYQTLSEDDRVTGFCRLVDKDHSEFLNEMYVALQNGEEIEQKYIDVYNEYAKEFLGGK